MNMLVIQWQHTLNEEGPYRFSTSAPHFIHEETEAQKNSLSLHLKGWIRPGRVQAKC